MHLITIPEGISEPIPVMGGSPLKAGQSIICTNAFAGSLLMSNWRVMIEGEMWALSPLLRAEALADDESLDPMDDLAISDWHVWLMRGGGFGDLLAMTPMIREIKRLYPNCTIHVARGDQYAGIFQGLSVIEESLPIDYNTFLFGEDPPESSEHLPKNLIFSFEGWIEGHPEAERTHIAQQMANKLGIDLKGDHRPDYKIFPEEMEKALQVWPRSSTKRVGVQYMASALYRSYPGMNRVIAGLLDRNYEVFVFGAPGQLQMEEPVPEGLFNMTQPGLTFRESAAVLYTCDCVVAPDSAFVQLAAALDIPVVGLYGAFDPKLRMVEGTKGKGIQGMWSCSPCSFHAATATDFPAGMPCSDKGRCVAIEQITPEEVIDEVNRLCSPIIIPT